MTTANAINKTFNMSTVAKEGLTYNIKLTGVNVFRLRIKIGCQIIKLAAFIMGVGIKIDNLPEDGGQR